MRTIYKYKLHAPGTNELSMPIGAKVLAVQYQGSGLQMWAECVSSAPLAPRSFEVIGTGWDMKGMAGDYIATIQEPLTQFVWHVFEVTR